MKLPSAITMVLATAAAAFAAPERVTVCSEIGNGFAIRRAQSVAQTIFSPIGMSIDWHRPAACPGGAILIEYSYATLPDFMPERLAYALPYEGVHIVVFYDRILKRYGQDQFSPVLGHVMAHEITHILEGVKRHSDTGIMKATFTPDDTREMARHPMTFATEDVDLIRQGADARRTRIAALR